MRRKLLLLVCAALILGVALALSASAEVELTLSEAGLHELNEVYDLHDGDEITLHRAVIPYEYSNEYGLRSETAAGHFFVENYEELAETLDGDPQWSVELVDGIDVDCFISQDDGQSDRCWLRLDEGFRPQSEGVARLKVNCEWGDLSTSVFVNVYYEEVDLPTGTTVPDEVTLQVSRSKKLSWHFGDDYLYRGDYDYLFMLDDSEDEFENHFTWINNHDGTVTLKPKANAAGCWLIEVANYDANIQAKKYVLFKVKDSSGQLPVPEIALDHPEHITRVVGPAESDEGVIYDNQYLFFDQIPNYDLLRAYYGTEPEWSFETDAPQGIHFDYDESYRKWYHLVTDQPFEEQGTFNIHVTVDWEDQHIEADTEVEYISEPLPTGCTLPTELHLKAGECQQISAYFEPSDFYVDGEGGGFDIDVHADTYFEWERWDEDGEYDRHVTFYEMGIYKAWVQINMANIHVGRHILVYVTDEDGNEPDVFPQLDHEEQDLEYVCALGEAEDPVYIESYLDGINLENYDLIEQFYGGDPWWNFYPVDDANGPYAYINVVDGNRRVEIRANTDELPDHELSADYVLALMEGDETLITRDIHIDFVNATMPEGIEVDREYLFDVGDEHDLVASFLPLDYTPNFGDPHINMGINDFPGDLDDCLRIECDGTTAHITALQPGTYVAWIDMCDGNIIATTYETVVIRVKDEHGNVPVLAPVFGEGSYEMTMSIEPDNTEGYDYYVSEGDSLFIRPENEEQLRGIYGNDWEWSFETIEGPQVDMYDDMSEYGFDMRVSNLNDLNDGDVSIVNATLRWGEGTVTIPITVNFIRLALPESLEWDTDIEMRSGDEYRAHVSATPEEWHEGFVWYDVEGFDHHFEKWNDDDDSHTMYIKCYRPGTYYGDCHIHAYNVFISGPRVTYRILDDEDQPVIPDLVIYHGELEYTAAAMENGEPEQGLWADHWINGFSIANADRMRDDYPDVFTGDPIWKVWTFEGTQTDAYLEDCSEDGDWTRIDVRINDVPTVSTDCAYEITCEWGGQSVSWEMCVHYVDDLPMPTGSNIPEVIRLEIGESYDWYGDFEPEDYDFYEGFHCDAWPNVEGADVEVIRYGDDHFRFTPHQTGVIWMHANVYASNIAYSKDVRLVVVDPNATLVLPDAIQWIDEEAFQGIDASVVVVPDGCEYIGPRAFANCPNLVEIQTAEGTGIDDSAFDDCNEVYINWR